MRFFSPIFAALAMLAFADQAVVRAHDAPCGECRCSRCSEEVAPALSQKKAAEMVYLCECHSATAQVQHKKSTAKCHYAQCSQHTARKIASQPVRTTKKPIAKEKHKVAITYRWVEKDERPHGVKRISRPNLPADNLSIASCARATDETRPNVATISHEESADVADELPQAFASDEPQFRPSLTRR